MRSFLPALAMILAGMPAAADVTHEDMARVYQELDESFVERKDTFSDEDFDRITEWVNEGVIAFWSRDFVSVMRNFARARQRIRGEEWDVDVDRLDAVSLRVAAPSVEEGVERSSARLVDAFEPSAPGTIDVTFAVYDGSVADPGRILLREMRSVPAEELAAGWAIEFPVAGPRTRLEVTLTSGSRRQERSRLVYRIRDLAPRAAALREAVDALLFAHPGIGDDLVSALADLEEQVHATSQTPMWFDLIDLLESLERDLAVAREGKDPLEGRTGTVLRGARTEKGSHVIYRIVLPPDYDPALEYPVVIALHGLGIDERTMLYTYGSGSLAHEAVRRGYVFIAPRSDEAHTRTSLTFGHSSDDAHVLAALADAAGHYSLDLGRVYLFGHSLGAIQSLQTASREPERFRAVVAVALSAAVDPSRIKDVPILMLWGEDDPLDALIRPFVLAAQLVGCRRLETKVVPHMGHVLILHFERETVFDFFESHGGPLVDGPRNACLESARALVEGDGEAFAGRQTAAVLGEFAERLAARQESVRQGSAEADAFLLELELTRDEFLALDAPAYLARSFESLLLADPGLALELAGRYQDLEIDGERLAGPDRCEVTGRFRAGTTAVRRAGRAEGRWRLEWEPGESLADGLRRF